MALTARRRSTSPGSAIAQFVLDVKCDERPIGSRGGGSRLNYARPKYHASRVQMNVTRF
jgi:hypothetical protein